MFSVLKVGFVKVNRLNFTDDFVKTNAFMCGVDLTNRDKRNNLLLLIIVFTKVLYNLFFQMFPGHHKSLSATYLCIL